MESEYDFSKGERGKFHDANAKFHLPVYLDSDVEEFLRKHANDKNVEIQKIVNDWLRNNLNVIKSVL